jgi:hypothetical protein
MIFLRKWFIVSAVLVIFFLPLFRCVDEKNRHYSFDHKGWHFMVLDSIQPIEGGSYRGRIDAGQMAWITSTPMRTSISKESALSQGALSPPICGTVP